MHLNPIRTNLTKHPAKYYWSSYKYYDKNISVAGISKIILRTNKLRVSNNFIDNDIIKLTKLIKNG